MKHFSDLLDDWATRRADAAAITAVGADGRIDETVSYAQLRQRVWSIAARLEAERLAGMPVLILAQSELAFSLAFLACLRAGAIAVPLGFPDAARLVRYAPRLRSVVHDAAPAAILATTADRQLVAEIAEAAGLDGLPWICLDDVDPAGADTFQPRPAKPDDVAWLQYTSGSTSTPKGVVLTHDNLVATEEMIRRVHAVEGRTLSWLPLSHDMGLVGGLLQPLYVGSEAMLMSPLTFLRRPARWLQLISRYGVMGTAAPNFGFEYCLRRVRDVDLTDVDLSTWVVAYNGAEPVRADVLQRFFRRFAPFGFRADTFFPCYGLAEATLIVSGRRTEGKAPRALRVSAESFERGIVDVQHTSLATDDVAPGAGGRHLVSCGRVAEGVRVRIVDPVSCVALAALTVGEIWVSGPNVARGYWRDEEATAATFGARLATSDEGPFLRTGDLGFLDGDEELFVTGRIKDLIIVDGRNHYPQDIEATVERCHPLVTPGGVAAFSVDRDGQEQLTVMAEVERSSTADDRRALTAAVREAVVTEHGIFPRRVSLLGRGGLLRTTSGKLQRRAVAAALAAGSLPLLAAEDAAAPAATEGETGGRRAMLVRWLVGQIAASTGVPPEEIDVHAPLASLGLGSRSSVELVAALEREVGRALPATLAWQFPTIHALASHLAGEAPAAAAPVRAAALDDEPIAIVGMACRFPGPARDLDSFWRMLLAGEEALGPLPVARWERLAGGRLDLHAAGIHSRRMGVLDDVEGFDAAFFGITPRETGTLDPQQRLLLEVSWQALEDAGVRIDRAHPAAGGVFVGISTDDMARLLESGRSIEDLDAYGGTGAAFSVAAGRVAHSFNLRGPCLAVDTACSSSLLAVHLAAQSLRRGECAFALAGGVNVILSPKGTAYLSRLQALSRAGRCRTFDASADGYVRSEGCGMIVLKRLSDAVDDGDRIWAVLRGSAVNHDGTSNGLTAPNGNAQEEVIRGALQRSGVDPRRIVYIECHGTGTPLGDPIEALALGAALKADRSRPLWIGSVKTNLGHLEAAAGIAGLMKAALALHHRRLPAHLHLEQPNAAVPWAELGLQVPRETVDLVDAGDAPAMGVSAFGLSGTNVHAVLEAAPQAPPQSEQPTPRGPAVLCLSARSGAALEALAGHYERRLRADASLSPTARACAALETRARFEHRAAVVADDRETLVRELATLASGAVGEALRGRAPTSDGQVAFLFTGQGSQYVGMGRGLYQAEPTFRAAMDQLDAVARSVRGRSLLGVMFEGPAEDLARTEWTQPALYALEVSLAALWRSWGIHPAAVAGHSIGELSAAQVAGVFDLDVGMRLALARGALMESACPPGAMLAVQASEEETRHALAGTAVGEGCELAAVNAPDQVVLSGSEAAISAAEDALRARGLVHERLPVSRAFHSAGVDAAVAGLEAAAASLPMSAPRGLDLLSNETGAVVGPEVASARYWSRQLRAPVRFDRVFETLRRRGLVAWLEIGPQPVLTALARRSREDGPIACSSLRRGRDEVSELRGAAGVLFCAGVAHDATAMLGCRPPRVALPGYPLEPTSHPLMISPGGRSRPVGPATDDGLHGAVHRVAWHESPAPRAATGEGETWLLFGRAEDRGLAALAHELRARGAAVVTHELAPAWLDAGTLERVLAPVVERPIRGLVWMVEAPTLDPMIDPRAGFDACVFGLLRVAEWLIARPGVGPPPRLWVATRGAQALPEDAAPPRPLATAVWGLTRGLAHELGQFRPATVDLDDAAAERPEALADLLLANDPEDRVLLRSGRAWVARLVTSDRPETPREPVVRADGAYLVTGGMGALGLETARWLVRQGGRHLFLVGRRPPTNDAEAAIAELRAAGADVVVLTGDIADPALAAAVVERAGAGGVPLRGVVHAAGALEPDGLGALDLDRAYRGLAGKVCGAINLHRLTAGLELEFFVLYSSAAALLGAPSHAVYSAGNGFLDGLARLRRAQGLPALSIEWGPFGDVGMAARIGPAGRAGFGGLEPMAASEGVSVLSRLLAGAEDAAVGVFRPSERLAVLAALASPFFSRWSAARQASASPVADAAARPPWRVLLSSSSREARSALLMERLSDLVRQVLGLPADTPIDPKVGLGDLGMDSLMALEIRTRVEAALGVSLPPTLMFERPDTEQLAAYLLRKIEPAEGEAPSPSTARAPARARAAQPIAIVGAACRFPGQSDDPQGYWRLLGAGRDAVTEVPPDRWDVDAYYDPTGRDPSRTYSRWGAFLREVDRFDAEFFRISPREAAAMDPQQRLLLEVAWEALENAGVAPQDLRESLTGVFMGIGIGDYATLRSRGRGTDLDPYAGTGTAFAFSAGRLSYFLGLRGPSLAVDTACSSSLVAVHLACQSLRNGESRAALAGGVHLMLSPHTFVYLSRLEALSKTGRCRTFDAGADGYVRGEGCGVLVLKRLDDALADGDQVWAVIRGSAVNHDGPSGGLTIPSGPAQEAVLRAALADAGVSASDVDYVECHGTGTALGDPIEVRALGEVLGKRRSRPLHIGSVKTNIGHLEAASGMAGLLKVVLAMQQGIIPAHLHFERPSDHVPWGELPFVVPSSPVPWPRSGRARIAGVSAFGLSGTNAHVIVEEAPIATDVVPWEARGEAPAMPYVLGLSARSETALRTLAVRFAESLRSAGPVEVGPICDTAGLGRSRFEHRAAVVGGSGPELAQRLTALSGPGVALGRARAHRRGACFLFSGQGSQYLGMGRGLYEADATFRAVLDRCDAVTRERRGEPLLPVMFEGAQDRQDRLGQTAWTQPALYALQVALLAVWRAWGIEPQVVLGHSVGELASAHAAGVMSVETGMVLALVRGELMQSVGGVGGMLAVRAGEPRIKGALADAGLDGALEVAAHNAPEQTVLTGSSDAIDGAHAAFHRLGIKASRLEVSHAFHSSFMDPALAPFAAAVAEQVLAAPQVALVSNLTGELAGTDMQKPSYWAEQLRRPVRFEAGLRTAGKQAVGVFIEIGPQPVLSALALETLGSSSFRFVASLRKGQPDPAVMAGGAAEAFAQGLPLRRAAAGPTRKVVLPNYPFERRRFWLDEQTGATPEPARPSATVSLPGQLLSSAGTERVFESRWRIGAASAPLGELRGVAVAGLDVWLDAILAAGEGVAPGRRVGLDRVAVRGCVAVLPEEETTAHIVLGPTDADGTRSARVASHLAGAGGGDYGVPWTVAVEGALVMVNELAADATVASVIAPRQLEITATGGDTSALRRRVLAAVLDFVSGAAATLEQPETLRLPQHIQRVRWWGTERPGPLAISVAVRDDAPDTWDAEVRDSGGLLVAYLGEVRVRAADWLDETLPAAPLPAQEIEWRPAGPDHPGAPPDRWIVLADRTPRAERLVREIEAHGRRAELAPPGPEAEWEALLSSLAGSSAVGWIHLGPLAATEIGPGEDPVTTLRGPGELLLRWLAALRAARATAPGWVIARGAEAVGTGVIPAAAALTALARVAGNESGTSGLGTIDLDPSHEPEHAVEAVVARLVAGVPGSSRLALREGEWLVPRLRTSRMSRVVPRLRGTHLVTGGLGAIGFALGRWLLAHGAEHVVLLGRSGARPAQADELDALRARGARVTVARGDVGDPEDVRRVLAQIAAVGPALRGVYHAAGTLDDGPLETQSWARAEGVLHAKVRGAEHLDRATAEMNLDAFVLFSSVAAVLGTPGQASYAAANAYLDALAERRQRAGRKAVSVAWGPWQGEGMAGRTRSEERWRAIGIEPVAPDAALAHLGRLLGDGPALRLVLPLRDPEALRRLLPAAAVLADGGAAASAPAAAVSGRLRAKLAETAPGAREAVLLDFVMDEIEALLGQSGARRLDPDRPLSEVGFDSLMAIKLRDSLQTALTVSLSATAGFDYPTPGALARHLLSRVQGDPRPEAPPPAELAPLASVEQQSAVDVDALSAEELLGFIDEKSQSDDPGSGETQR